MRKVKIELSDCDEVIIKCKNITNEVLELKNLIENDKTSLSLKLGESEYIIDTSSILFFESMDNRVCAHTISHMYYSDLKLYALESVLTMSFMRISKSSIINLDKIAWYKKDITGGCICGFEDSKKQVYVSRMYFKSFCTKLKEMKGII